MAAHLRKERLQNPDPLDGDLIALALLEDDHVDGAQGGPSVGQEPF